MIFFSLSSHGQVIEYHLSDIKSQTEKNTIHIEIIFQSDKSGITRLILPSCWTDADQLFLNIQNLELKGLEDQGARLVASSSPSEKVVLSKPNTPLKVTYDLSHDGQHHFKPYITRSLFSFIGKTAFVVPTFQLNTEPNTAQLSWSSANDNKAYRVVNSYGIDQLTQTLPMNELLEGLYMGGEMHLTERMDNNGNKLFFAYTTPPSPKLKEWENDAVELINFQRQAMRDKTSHYLVTTILFDDKDKPFSGTHLKNSVLFGYGESWLSTSREEWIRYASHEFFHHWIGHKIKASNDYVNSMWFFEGFTDFLSIELALKAGLLNEQTYIDFKNRVLRAHYVSPFQSMPNRDIARYYWDNPELHGAPYIKGHLFAQYCNQLLRKQNRSLLEVIWELAQPNSQYYREYYTEQDLLDALSELISTELIEAYTNYFIHGDFFRDEIDLKHGGFSLEYAETLVPKYDLNLVETFLENKVIGLSKKSKAHQQGLREGMSVSSIEIDPILKEEEVRIVFAKPYDKPQTITLQPHYEMIEMPVFRASAEDTQ